MIRILTGIAGNAPGGKAFSLSYGDELTEERLSALGINVDALLASHSAERVAEAAARRAPETAAKKRARKR